MRSEPKIAPELTQAEWQAVSSALADASACGCAGTSKPSIVGHALRSLFPVRSARPRPNPSLDAIRRFVCETRRRGRKADEHEQPLQAQGFNARQIDALTLLSS